MGHILHVNVYILDNIEVNTYLTKGKKIRVAGEKLGLSHPYLHLHRGEMSKKPKTIKK